MKKTLHYLEQLITIPSPTGYTYAVQEYLMKTLTHMGYAPQKTAKGMIIVTVDGKNTQQHRVLTAHVDTLGTIVRAIKSDGRLKLDKIGGFPWNMIEGENCTVHIASNNTTTTGTILLHQTSTHVYREAGTLERTQDNMEVRLDELVTSEKETRDLGIEVGDFVSFDPRFIITNNGFVKSRFLDDKVSAALLLTLLENLINTNQTLPYTTHFAFSTNEEIGYGYNSSVDERVVEYLAIDMGAIGDDQQTDEYSVSICVKDTSGPYHFNFRQHLVALANENNIEYKLDIYPFYGSDASAAMSAGAEVKHALIGAGIESSHSYERTHVKSIEATGKLIYAYVNSELVSD